MILYIYILCKIYDVTSVKYCCYCQVFDAKLLDYVAATVEGKNIGGIYGK